MAKRRKLTQVPSYRQDPRDPNRALAVWKDQLGNRRSKILPGEWNSPESRTAIEQLKAEVKASVTGKLPKRRAITVAAMLGAYLKHARNYYRLPDGTPTSMVGMCEAVAKAVCALFAETPAAGFRPLHLKDAMQTWVGEGHSRDQCNRRLLFVKRIFKWAASEEMVPADVYLALTTVTGLRKGRTTARESIGVGPVSAAVVHDTLPHLNRFLAGMVLVQWHTGMRPGEACTMRRCDIDMSGEVWFYTPVHHKTAHKGKERVIAIGPKAQDVLKPLLTDDPGDYLFSSVKAVAEARARQSLLRKTPRWASHIAAAKKKRRKAPKRVPVGHYKPHSYERAIREACRKAFPPPGELAQGKAETWAHYQSRLTDEQKAEVARWHKSHGWDPNQLRHSFATEVRKLHGLEAAQVMLGHSRADVTQVYAEKNVSLAARVAKEIG